MNSPQQMLPGAQGSPPKRRASAKDLFAVLFLLACLGVGLVVMVRGLATDRMQLAETPWYVTPPPPQVLYDPADTRKLIGEIAGCVLTLAVLAVGCWRLRRRPSKPRLERLPAPRVGETREKWIASPPPHRQPVRQPARRPASGSIAAERLSVVVWTDHLARQEGERA